MSDIFPMPAGLATVYPDRTTWLDARRAVIGGSDIAPILGLKSFSSKLAVYYSKVNEAVEEENESMAWGSALEPVILAKWGNEAGVTYDDRLMIVRCTAFPFLGASPDAVETSASGRPIRWIEVKNVRSDAEWRKSEVGMPERVYAQVQHGMLCSGLSSAVVIALVGGSKLLEVPVEADPTYQHSIILAADAFWNDFVRPETPPEPDGSEASQKALTRAYVASGGTVEVPFDLWNEYRTANEAMGQVKDEVERLKQLLEQEMGEAEEATVDGTPVATWKVSTRNTIDTPRLRKELPEVAKKYNRVTPTRTFRPL